MTIYSPDKSIKAIICKNDTDITLKEYYILDPNRNYTRCLHYAGLSNLTREISEKRGRTGKK